MSHDPVTLDDGLGGRRMRRRLLLPVAVLSLLAPPPVMAQERAVFRDVAGETGLDFHYFNGMSGELYFPEMTGGGAALFDYDDDGDLDAFFVQGHMLGDAPLSTAIVPPRHAEPATPRLYRNDLVVRADGSRVLGFTDVTAASGIEGRGYGMGVISGDFDNDGRIDLYVTNFGPNQLLRNNGDGTFSDVTERAGVDDPRWSVPAVFFDYDRDGWLDLYVGNYVDFRIATHKTCSQPSGARDYCGPAAYAPVPDRLFRNRGDGTFEDVSEPAGLGREYGPALGATVADFDGDGWLDLYVANDGAANQLWLNGGDGTFRNEAVLAGCAVNEEGRPEASMGTVAGDLDGDGDMDLFMTHLAKETNTVYRNDGNGVFADRSKESGLGLPSYPNTGFGVALFDYDNDSILDLFVANGAVTLIEEQVRRREAYPLAEPNQLYRGIGEGRFMEAAAAAGEVVALPEVSRGVAAGDIDNDGDTDLLVVNSAGPARLLLNQVGQEGAWLGLRLVTGRPPRDALGAVAAVVRSGAPTLWRRAGSDGSYASGSDPRALVGLGETGRVELVRVWWPDGVVEEFPAPPSGRYSTLVEGSGEPSSVGPSGEEPR